MRAPIAAPSPTTDPAATIARSTTWARCRTIEPVPIRACASTTQPSRQAPCPTTTSSLMTVGRSSAQWITALSWIELPAPISMCEESPRSTAPNQMFARSPTRTSPIRTAVGASHTSSPIAGVTPSSSMIVAISLTPRPGDYTVSSVSQVSHVEATPIEELAPRTEEEVREHLASGKLVEGLQHMSPHYLQGIRRILTVSADTEFVSAPAYLRAAQHAPALNNFGSAMSIVQDELAHAHIGYRLLGDLGVDMDRLIYERPAGAFKYPYAFDVPLDSWTELVCANALYDQAGYVLLSDVHASSTFGPWKRALAKVDKEETFHLRHGRTWLKKMVKEPAGKAEVQAAVDWMFILTLEWFGLPDARKRHGIQLEYGFKGLSNDELRQDWMAAVVPFMEEVGIDVPAHWDGERWAIDCPFPRAFDAEAKRWGDEISWDEV